MNKANFELLYVRTHARNAVFFTINGDDIFLTEEQVLANWKLNLMLND